MKEEDGCEEQAGVRPRVRVWCGGETDSTRDEKYNRSKKDETARLY